MKRVLSTGDIALATLGNTPDGSSDGPFTQVRSKRSKKSNISAAAQSAAKCVNQSRGSTVDENEKKIQELMLTINDLQQTVKSLASQVNFLLSFVGAVDTSPLISQDQQVTYSSTVSQPAVSQQSTISESIQSASVDVVSQSYAAIVSHPAQQSSVMGAPVCKAVMAAVCDELSERTRRSCNLVVTGLHPVQGTTDKEVFLSLCDLEFGFRPTLISCRRIGRTSVEGRVRPLLVTLPTAGDASNLLGYGRQLRFSTSDYNRENVYLNPDMTKQEAKAAYDERVRRRQAKAGRASAHQHTDDQRRRNQPARRSATLPHTSAATAMVDPNGNVNSTVACPSSLRPDAAPFNTSGAIAAGGGSMHPQST